MINLEMWAWPQWFFVVAWGIRLVASFINDGEIKTERISFINNSIAIAISFFILGLGGFFN